MSQLYFTSSLIPNKRFLRIEELFDQYSPLDTLFVFDTNVVVYFKELFYNSQKFIKNQENHGVYNELRYLIKSIEKNNLMVDASLGVDESSRKTEDFSLNMEKAKQTQKAILELFKMNLEQLDKHIQSNIATTSIIKNESKYTLTKVSHLEQESFYENILTISYACSLKIVILYEQLIANRLAPLEAYFHLYEFMTKDLDCVGGTLIIYALYLFGGDEGFKKILISKENISPERKLHQIFNGSIDLIYPYLVDRMPEISYSYWPIRLNPIFVTFDKRISILHSLINTRIIFEGDKDDKFSYNPELVELKFLRKLSWSNKELEEINNLTRKDMSSRLNNVILNLKDSNGFLPIIERLEHELICNLN